MAAAWIWKSLHLQIVSRAVIATCILVFTIPAQQGGLRGEDIDTNMVLRQASAAYDAVIQNLHSGAGSGLFEEYQVQDGKLILKTRSTLTTLFDRGKYCIELQYREAVGSVDRRIIICDRSGIFSSTFWKGIQHPTGAEGYVSPVHRSGLNRPIRADFPWDISQLTREVWNVSQVLKNHPPASMKVEKLKTGDFRVSYALGKSTVSFEISPAMGYHVTSCAVTSPNRPVPTTQWLARWKMKDDLWYVAELDRTRSIDPQKTERVRLVYEDFSPNPTVPQSRFTLDALRLPPNSRILDQRPNTKQPTYFYRPGGEEQQLDRMIDNLANLPTPFVPQDKLKKWRVVLWWLAGISTGVVVMTGIGMFWRRRAKRELQNTIRNNVCLLPTGEPDAGSK